MSLKAAHADCSMTRPSDQTSSCEIRSIDRWKHTSEKRLEHILSSALLALEDVSTILKSGVPDEHTVRVALHPAERGAVRQNLLDRELRLLALTDDLTCLYNRRGFFATATQQLKLARRNVQVLSLFFCDVDNLKKINDSFGHSEGDLALIRAADALERTFRDSDILARLGGDEFAVLASETSDQDQQAILCRLERSLLKAYGDEFGYGLSLSVGVARYDPKNPVSLGELMVRADQDMYEKKRKKQKT